MGNAVFTVPRAARPHDRPSLHGVGVGSAALPILLVLACCAGWWLPLNSDVSWQYWVARQMRGGARLYSDIVEVNPPLWFWEAVPISAIADRAHIDARHLVIVSAALRTLAALLLTARLLDDERPGRRLALLAGLALVLGVMPIHDFGEREHLMLFGALPYAALIARRRAGDRAIPNRLAACVGLFAAYGFALKPHFALVPLALEAWLALGLRGRWRPVRIETAALIAVAALYGFAILLFAPDYLRRIVPLAMAAYGAFAPPVATLFGQYWLLPSVLAALTLATFRRALPVQVQAAAIAALALGASYFLQGKAFPYQALPMAAALAWALWLFVVTGSDYPKDALRRALAATILALFATTTWLVGAPKVITADRATDAVGRLPPGATVAVISAHSWLAFPFVEDQRFVWPMRGIGLWTLPLIARVGDGAGATDAGRAIRRQTLDTIAADLWCHPPDAILVDDPDFSPALRGTGFSYDAFIRSDPRIRALLAQYRTSVATSEATVYARQRPLAPRGTGCRNVAIRPDFR